MTTTPHPDAAPIHTTPPEEPGGEPRLLGRVAGTIGLAQIVIMFAAITQEVMIEHGSPLATLQSVYGDGNLTRVFGGGYVEALSFVFLMPALIIIARLFGQGTELTRVAAQTFLALGVVWIASTLAVGFAPGAAAMYGAQHGADIHSVAMVTDIRTFGYYLQVAVQGGMALALGAAAVWGRAWPRVVGWGGIVIGVAILVGTPFANNGLGLIWLLWWVCVNVALVRGSRVRA